MDTCTITTAEYAKIRGCSDRAITKQIASGKIESYMITNKRGKQVHAIPIDQLNEEEKIAYYKSKGILKDDLSIKNCDQFENMTEEERKECVFWEQLLNEWQLYRNKPGAIKAEADKLFVTKAKLEHPEKDISRDILYRKWKRLKDGDLYGLIDNRGKSKSSAIDEEVWQIFLSFYLDEAQHPIKKCYQYTQMYLEQEDKLDKLSEMPAYCTFTRHLKSDLSEAVKTLGRYGDKAFDDRCAPYIMRSYDDMQSNDYWIGDNHTMDTIVTDGETQFRLYLTAYMDARSGILTGIYITDNPCAQASIYALKNGIEKYGIPKHVYLDNGREFLTGDFGGTGHRTKKKNKDQFTPPPILQRLGIEMTNAIPRNAKAKTIERRFLDFKNSISRLFTTYTGGNVVEKPEILKTELKNGNIPNRQEYIKQIETLIEYYMNYEVYNGKVVKDKGKRKIDLFNENLHTKITATDEDLALMLLRSTKSQKIRRDGVYVKVGNEKFYYYQPELLNMLGKEVYLRYDPDDLSKVRMYDLEDRFIMEVKSNEPYLLEYGASKEDLKQAMALTRKAKKATKQALDNTVLASIDRNTALELVLKQAEQNKETEVAGSSIEDIVVKKAKEEPMIRTADIVDINRMVENSMRRQGGGTYDN